MKKIYCLAIVAIALFLTGCQVADVDNEAKVGSRTAPTFTSSFESIGTRTYVDNDLYMHWTADERLSIFTSSYNEEYRFDGQTGATGGSFSKVNAGQFVTGNPISTNYGICPYNVSTSLTNDEKILLELPAIQAYAPNSFGAGANTMVAVTNGTSDTFLPFKNVCGYLVVKLYGEGKVTKVIFEGNDGEMIAGAATVTASYGSNPEITMSDDATTSITIDCGNRVELGKTAETATEFWFVIPPTTFSKGFTIKALSDGALQMTKSTAAERTIQRNVVNEMSAIEVVFDETPIAVPEIVDLGLSVKWASFNVGASRPEEYGNYYAWGEIETKSDYSWSTYKWCKGSASTLTKYCSVIAEGYNGFIDNKTMLDPEDDIVQDLFGDKWHMPTDDEWEELMALCTWDWTSINGVCGYTITGKNGNSIFLPAAGYYEGFSRINDSEGCYLSISNAKSSSNAWVLLFNSNKKRITNKYRYLGETIRPVFEQVDNVSVTGVSLNKSSMVFTDLHISDTLIANVYPSFASTKDVIWTSSNTNIATVSDNGIVNSLRIGNAVITATTIDGGYIAKCNVIVTSLPNGAVDLGLSVKWNSFNLGASRSEEYGDYYAWGETESKFNYSWSTYKWCKGSRESLTKYCNESTFGFNEYIDDKHQLDSIDDVASQLLGEKWRMPTQDEGEELLRQCTWTRTRLNNTDGYLVTGTNGFSIFLPGAGYMDGYSLNKDGSIQGIYFWTSSLCWTDLNPCPDLAFSVSFSAGGMARMPILRYLGLSIRPVCD